MNEAIMLLCTKGVENELTYGKPYKFIKQIEGKYLITPNDNGIAKWYDVNLFKEISVHTCNEY